MKDWLHKLGHMRFSLSTRLILSMAAMVFLTAIISVVIFNIIITEQTNDLESRLQTAFTQLQDYRKQNQTPPTAILENVKAVLADNSLSPEEQLGELRKAMRPSDNVSFPAVLNILQDSGLPVSFKGGPRDSEALIKSSIERQTEVRLISPVIQSSLIGSLLGAICSVLLGLVLARTVVEPLRTLKRASERIADGNYALEITQEGKDDVGRLARSFNRMARGLRQAEQKRKDLVANVAHELRTPLSAIQGYTEVLRDGLVSSPERQTEMYEHILKEVRHLTHMVESMRVWVNNEQALEHLNMEAVPARYPAQMVLERFQPTATQKEVTLSLEVENSRAEPQVQADSEALNHILSNLVDNALRYTSAGGKIVLHISSSVNLPSTRQRVVWFEVADTGSGIPSEHLPFVFERFYRVDKSRDRNTGGSGLGLAIVRDNVQALGGDVQIASTVGVGTTIKFWLPASVQPTKNSKSSQLLFATKN